MAVHLSGLCNDNVSTAEMIIVVLLFMQETGATWLRAVR